MDQLIRLTSHPVEFEEEEFKPSINMPKWKSVYGEEISLINFSLRKVWLSWEGDGF